MSSRVLAAVYGRGGYDRCGYQACLRPVTTTITTPAGLEVAVNLSNGQTIPHDGYTIVVTPLNGQGASFASVAFYVNGALAYTATPDTTGTARWLWKPGSLTSAKVKLVITDQKGNVTTQEFAVTVQGVQLITPTAASAANPPLKSGIAGVIQQAYRGAKQAINALPPPVVYSFPYILFVLLGANVLLLLLQAKRELREYHTLRGLLTRLQVMNEGKQTLTQLVSHYLRTPLTVMGGGIELLHKEPGAAVPATQLQAVAERIQTKVDGLINQTQAAQPITAASIVPVVKTERLWQRPALFLPLLLIAIIVLPFNYLAAHAGSFSISQVNLTAQLIIFGLLALASYQVFRRLQLRKRDARELQQLATAAKVDSEARDRLITVTVDTLNEDLQTVDTLSAALPASRASRFVHDGQQRLHKVLDTFAVAKRLRGGHVSEPSAATTLQSLVDDAVQPLRSIIEARHVTVAVSGSATLRVARLGLLTTVLTSLLDNAVAYSPERSTIEVNTRSDHQAMVVTVSDHGSGIPAHKLPLLFQPFSKAEGALTFTHEGMGFSLYLAKLIMTYLGGSITLDSTPGRGTTVQIQLASV